MALLIERDVAGGYRKPAKEANLCEMLTVMAPVDRVRILCITQPGKRIISLMSKYSVDLHWPNSSLIHT